MAWKILVVDDSRLARTLVKKALLENGFTVIGEAGNGKEAMERFFELKPDLVTMDIVMPDMDGTEASKAILNKDPGARILMVTSLNQQVVAEDMMKMGVKAIISKPFEPQDLVRSVNAILAR